MLVYIFLGVGFHDLVSCCNYEALKLHKIFETSTNFLESYLNMERWIQTHLSNCVLLKFGNF